MFKLDLEKARNQRSNSQRVLDHKKSKRSAEKQLLVLYWLCQSLWLCRSQQTVENSSRDEEFTLPASWDICMQVKKQQLELDMVPQTSSTLGKKYVNAVYCHPAYLTYMQSTSWETLGWKKHRLEWRLLGKMLITSVCRGHHSHGRKWRGTKKPLDESERGERKSWLKA